jgi:hypothetical protein
LRRKHINRFYRYSRDCTERNEYDIRVLNADSFNTNEFFFDLFVFCEEFVYVFFQNLRLKPE